MRIGHQGSQRRRGRLVRGRGRWHGLPDEPGKSISPVGVFGGAHLAFFFRPSLKSARASPPPKLIFSTAFSRGNFRNCFTRERPTCPLCLGYQFGGEKLLQEKLLLLLRHTSVGLFREREREREKGLLLLLEEEEEEEEEEDVIAFSRGEKKKNIATKREGKRTTYCVDAISFFKVGPDPTNFTGTFLRW